MRASDLLRFEVVTSDDRPLGHVSDFRIVQDGPLVAGVQNAFRIDSLVVGRGGLADRLGYIRGGVQGPWLVSAIATCLERRAHLIDVADIDRWDDDKRTIRLKPGAVLTHPA